MSKQGVLKMFKIVGFNEIFEKLCNIENFEVKYLKLF